MSHIWLIGMMGSGKSSVGRELALRRAQPFYDTDAAVEAAVGMTIAEIFGSEGEGRFRSLESEAVHQIASQPEGIVATGGGVVLDGASVETMRSSGVTVLLEADSTALISRVAQGDDRPLIAGDPEARIGEIAADRAERYAAAADVIVDADGSIAQVADRVEQACAAS
ncbi:MAG: shikimate kinase [Actinomycetota bacterium]